MARPAEQIVCSDCGATFPFSAAEAEFYASHALATPKRCPSCRAARKSARPPAHDDSSGRPRGAARGARPDGGAARARAAARPRAAASRSDGGGREGGWSPPRYTGDVNEYRSPMQVPQRDTEYRAPAFRDAERAGQVRTARGTAGSPQRRARSGTEPSRAPARETPNRRGGRATFQVQCSACGAQAEVPFEPQPGREVFCQSCHHARRTAPK